MEEKQKPQSNTTRSNLLKQDLKDFVKVEGTRRSTRENKLYFLECLMQTKGVVTAVCMRTNVSRATYYHWMKTDKNFKEAVESIKSEKAEILEDRLFTLALEGKMDALRYLHAYYAHSRQVKRETSVHIHHHRDKKDDVRDKEHDFTITEMVDDLLDKLNEQEAKSKAEEENTK